MKSKVSFTVDQAVLKEIDQLRDFANRSAFANHILKLGLKEYKAGKKHIETESPNPRITRKAEADGKS